MYELERQYVDLGPQEGTIKFFNEKKGFGFIEVDGFTEDVYFFRDVFYNKGMLVPSKGQTIEVRVLQEGDKLKAIEVISVIETDAISIKDMTEDQLLEFEAAYVENVMETHAYLNVFGRAVSVTIQRQDWEKTGIEGLEIGSLLAIRMNKETYKGKRSAGIAFLWNMVTFEDD